MFTTASARVALPCCLATSHWNPPRHEVERAVEAILAAVWHAEDWDVAVRDPSLLTHEPRTPEQLAAWQALLEASTSSRQ